jgi:hypothetical protein
MAHKRTYALQQTRRDFWRGSYTSNNGHEGEQLARPFWPTFCLRHRSKKTSLFGYVFGAATRLLIKKDRLAAVSPKSD